MDEIKIKTMDIELPTWDLSEIYENIDDPNIEIDIKKIKELSEDFSIQWKGKIKDLNRFILLLSKFLFNKKFNYKLIV